MTSRLFRRSFTACVLIALTWTFANVAMASSPEAGQKGNYRGECRRMTKQINHFENTILPMAVGRGNSAWEQATVDQVERLWHRRADLCPKYGRQRTLLAKAVEDARKVKEFVVTAGKAAATYFSGGLSGGVLP